jgi:DNA-binding NarL/FixJ family response regulator
MRACLRSSIDFCSDRNFSTSSVRLFSGIAKFYSTAAWRPGVKQREQIAILNQAGLSPKDIAALLGTSSNTVRVELVALRKAGRGGKGGKRA